MQTEGNPWRDFPAPMPLTPTLMLASWSWRRAAFAYGWPLMPLVRLLPRDGRLMAQNVYVLVWARWVVLRWYELNAAPAMVAWVAWVAWVDPDDAT